jgi:hypothetical protein
MSFVPRTEPQLQPLEENIMNTKITALILAAATAFAFTPKPAIADHKELAVVGGIIGGIIIAAAISDYGDNNFNHATVGYRSGDHCSDGYWNTVAVKVWVPGYWVVERGHHGHSHRRFVPGHYEGRNDRVWVAYNRHNRYDRHDDRRGDRYDRDNNHGYGYGNDRRDRDYRR